jgi:hypothetical protein
MIAQSMIASLAASYIVLSIGLIIYQAMRQSPRDLEPYKLGYELGYEEGRESGCREEPCDFWKGYADGYIKSCAKRVHPNISAKTVEGGE